MRFITHAEIDEAAKQLALGLAAFSISKVYPIPRGGVPAAYAVQKHMPFLEIVDNPQEAQAYIDDLIDSGATKKRYAEIRKLPFYALFTKEHSEWLVFPWEHTEEGSAEDIGTRLLQYIGEDPSREGLQETPKRFLRAWREYWAKGYSQNPKDVMKVFEDGAEGCDEMIVVKDIPVWSHCEHHLCPVFGTATVGYIPNQRIIGLSKIARLVDVYARRLQVQERLGNQVVDAIQEHLQPLGCGIVLKLRHLCMESRGVEKSGSETVTSALRGVFREQAETRAEFLALARV